MFKKYRQNYFFLHNQNQNQKKKQEKKRKKNILHQEKIEIESKPNKKKKKECDFLFSLLGGVREDPLQCCQGGKGRSNI